MEPEALFDVIARPDFLEEASTPLQAAWRKLFAGDGGQKLKDALHGTWLGHPLHPVLTDIPVGAWTVALVLDALQTLNGGEDGGMGDAADATIAIGLVGALGAAITGITDWSETDGRGKRLGLLHGLMNVAAVSLYTASLVMRRNGSRQSGVALSSMGYAIAGMSAYIGGHLVFGEQLGIDHTATAEATEPADYTAALHESELADETPRRVDVRGARILLFKRSGEIHAISEVCPHLGGPLSEGKVVGDAIECPWHRSQLSLTDGSVVCGPTTFPARVYDVRVRSGWIEVRAANKQASVEKASK